jgi:hypothetical protein
VNIPCVCGANVPGGTPWETFLLRIDKTVGNAKVLIVILTKALFKSKPCMEEIYKAIESKCEIFPVRYENDLPPMKEQWTDKSLNLTSEEKVMAMKVRDKLSKVNSIPAPPATVGSYPKALDDLVRLVSRAIGHTLPTQAAEEVEVKPASATSKPTPAPSQAAEEIDTPETKSAQFQDQLNKAVKVRNFGFAKKLKLKIAHCSKLEKEIEEAIELENYDKCEELANALDAITLESVDETQAAEDVEVKSASATIKPTPVPAAAPAEPMSEKEKEVKEMADNNTIDKPIKGDGRTPLIQAAREGDVEKVKFLIEYGASIDLGDKYGWTALIIAAWNNRIEIAKVLIASNAKLDLQNKYGWTALIIAAFHNYIEIAKVLIASNAKLDLQNKYGDTALEIARDRAYTKMVQLLLEEAGAKE